MHGGPSLTGSLLSSASALGPPRGLGGGSALTLTGAQKNRRCEDLRPSGDPASRSPHPGGALINLHTGSSPEARSCWSAG